MEETKIKGKERRMKIEKWKVNERRDNLEYGINEVNGKKREMKLILNKSCINSLEFLLNNKTV